MTKAASRRLPRSARRSRSSRTLSRLRSKRQWWRCLIGLLSPPVASPSPDRTTMRLRAVLQRASALPISAPAPMHACEMDDH